MRGRAAIISFRGDICSRAMTHRVDTSITEGNQLAFTQACACPDGTKVYCIPTVEMLNGQIAKRTVVQAWDE